MVRRWSAAALFLVPAPALAAPAFSCAGFAQAGAAELFCSHTDPRAPPQICTYSWTLAPAAGGASAVQGSFMLTPGQQNVVVYQGAGFNAALGTPVVMCQGRRREG